MKKNVIEYLEDAVQKYPQKTAFEDPEKSITFYSLQQKAQQLAVNIIRFMAGEQNRPVAIYMEKGVDAIVAIMGVIYSGNFYIPLDIHSPKERTNKIVNTLQPSLILVKSKDDFKPCTHPILELSYESHAIDRNPIDTVLQKQIDTDPLYVLFTSGSTGTPKGVTISHRAVLDYSQWLVTTFAFSEKTVFGNQAPLYFDNSVLDIYSTLKTGAATVFLPNDFFTSPQKLFAFMAEKRVNTIFWVPSALTLATGRKKLQMPGDLHLEKILFCGEVMPVKTLHRLQEFYPNAYYANLYGPTEITDVCCYYEINRTFSQEEALPIGKACRNTDVLLFNEENKLCKKEEIGELCVRGSGLSLGYYNNQKATEAVFVQNPLHNAYEDKMYRTGDLAKQNEKGEFLFLGRKDSQIKHLGYRIELGEVEAAASLMAEVAEQAAFYDEEKQQILLCCTCQANTNEADVMKYLEKKLPTYMLPSRIYLFETFPHTPNGKVDRKKLKEQIIQNRG